MMKLKYLSILGLAALVTATGCKKNNDLSSDKLPLNNRTAAYTGYTDIVHSRDVNTSTLDTVSGTGGGKAISFDNHQAWFDFTTVDNSTHKGRASWREAWNLGFWNGSGLDRVILNYTVTTQAVYLPGRTSITGTTPTGVTQLKTAYDSINGGTLGMGALSTFDFHREGQFVIGTPTGTNKVYLMKIPPVQVHPDTTGSTGAPVAVSYFMVAVNISGSTYNVSYRAISPSGSGASWTYLTTSPTTIAVPKTSGFQYSFVKFNSTVTIPVQPASSQWNLGLSAVTLKRYMSTGDAYAYAIKGVVLNNNSGVEVYRVQSTGSTAGAPGPYDPNFSNHTAASDPALNTANSIESRFLAYKVDSIQSSLFSKTTQEEIGQYYRRLDMGNYQLFVDRFFVIKLANGDIYKLKFDNLSSGSTSNPVNNGIRVRYSKIATTP